jgi:hypothetical protein
MQLTGKCKEDFEKFIYKKYELNNRVELKRFNDYPESMQYGVYVDFFDSCDIDSDEIYKREESIILNKVQHIFFKPKDYRLGARTATIEKANEFYNIK